MSDQTKIQLSPHEMDLLRNPEWILTKNIVVKKAQTLLERVMENIMDFNKQHHSFPAEVMAVSPKISKGENYLGLPWLILDYPRYFDKDNTCAIRTMFWWGNYFSTTLHLSGKYKENFSHKIISAFPEISQEEFYICINDDPWQHHLEKENYRLVSEFSLEKFMHHIQSRPFIKLAQRISFEHWDNAVTLLSENFVRVTNWMD